MKNNMKALTLPQALAVIMTFSYGFRVFWRGLFWFKEQDSVLQDSQFYSALHDLLPIWSWGIFVAVSGLILIASALFIGSSQQSKICSYLLLVGGFMVALLYFFMTSASIFNAINWLTTVHMAIMSATGLIVAFVGGADIAKRG